MSRSSLAIVGTSGILALLVVVALRLGVLPPGVPREWVWLEQKYPNYRINLFLATTGILAFAVFAALGMRFLSQSPRKRVEAAWVAALFVASVLVQATVQSCGPVGQGLSKWSSLGLHGASGYFGVAKREVADPWKFWAEYPSWIKSQDVLHIGTHPPGLILVCHGFLKLTAASPVLTSTISSLVPYSTEQEMLTYLQVEGWSKPERAAIVLMGFLTLLSCSATVVPLYLLARNSGTPAAAWATAAMWPLAPSIVMFQPTADTAFPLMATSALALTVGGGWIRAVFAGVILAVGMQFSLVFLPVGLSVGMVQWMRSDRRLLGRLTLFLTTGFGFLIATLFIGWLSRANPFEIWWSNQTNHGRFYRAHPRTYQLWVFVNLLELAVSVGLPTTVLVVLALLRRKAPIAAVSGLLVLLVMNFSGKNLSEVARLWIPLMPPLFLAAGTALPEGRDSSRLLGTLLMVLGLQTVTLQSLLQVIYPI